MKTIVSIVLTIGIYGMALGQSKIPSIQFNKNIELFGYLVHLGDPADNSPDHPIAQILNQHENDKQLPALMRVFTLAAEMEYGFLVDMCYSLPELPLSADFEVQKFLTQQYPHQDSTELAVLAEVISAVNQLAKESQFAQVWADLAPFRAEALKDLSQRIPSPELLSEMERIYEREFSHYKLVPSLTIWPTAGWGYPIDSGQTALFIFGPLAKDFDFTDQDKFYNLAIHEFGHSFVNDVVLENRAIIHASDTLFAPVREAMYPQGYHNWETCVIEHFVRAGEVIVPEVMGDTAQSINMMHEHEKNRSFIYLPFIVEHLKQYRLEQGLSYKIAVRKTLVDMKAHF